MKLSALLPITTGTALGVAKALKKRKKNKYKIVINDSADGKQIITGWDPKSVEGWL